MSDSEDITDTVEGRVFDIRRRLGKSVRKPLNSRKFAELLTAKAREMGLSLTFDSSWVSRTENGTRERGLTVDEIAVLAAVDPEDRGREWMAWKGKQADRLAYLAELREAERRFENLQPQMPGEAEIQIKVVEEVARKFFRTITDHPRAIEEYVQATIRTLRHHVADAVAKDDAKRIISKGS